MLGLVAALLLRLLLYSRVCCGDICAYLMVLLMKLGLAHGAIHLATLVMVLLRHCAHLLLFDVVAITDHFLPEDSLGGGLVLPSEACITCHVPRVMALLFFSLVEPGSLVLIADLLAGHTARDHGRADRTRRLLEMEVAALDLGCLVGDLTVNVGAIACTAAVHRVVLALELLRLAMHIPLVCRLDVA